MLTEITKTEYAFDALLPLRRLEHAPSAELLKAARNWSQAVWDKAAQLGPMPLTTEQLYRGLNLARCPVYICGAHRSGTTLVQDLLDGHLELVVLPSEGTYFTNLEFKLKNIQETDRPAYLITEWLRRLANPINQPPFWLLGRSAGTNSPYVDFARYAMAWLEELPKDHSQRPHLAIVLAYAACTGKLMAKFWVDKTPTNERFLKRIWQEVPDAKVIQVIREPVATLSSRRKMEPSITMKSALSDLKTSYKVAIKQSAVDEPRFLLLRYEELCAEPKKTGEKLAAFLRIDFTAGLSQPTVAGKPSQANSSFNSRPAPGQILKADQHKQSEVLSLAEKQRLSAHVGDLARKLNYPTMHVEFAAKLYLRLKYLLNRR